MKNNVVSLVLASAIGGAIALGGAQLLNPKTAVQTVQVSTTDNSSVQQSSATQFAHNQGTLGRPESFAEAADRAMPAVVNITAITEHKARNEREQRYYKFFGSPGPSQSTGSGVIISDKGYIVTNNHVIKDATKVDITLSDNRKFEAEVMGTDPSTDLAVLKITGKNLPVIDLANSDETRVGEWVLAVGNPYNLTSTVTAGIVSAKGRDLKGNGTITDSFIQTDAAVNPGNSGGALVNTRGELVGINTAISSKTGSFVGYSFAVPSNIAKKVVEDLMEFGRVQQSILGIGIDPEYTEEGVRINSFPENSGALKGGLKVGDVITKVNSVKISKFSDLVGQLKAKRPGEYVNVTVNRNGKNLNRKVKLSKKDLHRSENYNLDLKDLTKEEMKELSISYGVKIARDFSERVDGSSIKGFIITKINMTKIRLHFCCSISCPSLSG